MFLLQSVQVSAYTNFKDLNQYKAEIYYLTGLRVINGYKADNTFRPEQPIKRIQAIQMILREMNVTVGNSPNPNLTDMNPSDYGYHEVAKAVELGIIGGKTAEDGSKYFDPWGTLTRAQMAKILSEAYKINGTYYKDFTDVPKDDWAYGYVSALAANNITTGYQDSTFKPVGKLSRQHFAVFMARYLDVQFKPIPELQAHFIDVGQGDSSLVVTPNGKTILIDGGRPTAGEKVVNYLKKAGITSIDVVVATHPDADHIGGLMDVLEQFQVKKVLDSGKTHTSQTYLDYLTLIDEKNIPFEVAVEGSQLTMDPSLLIKVLNSSTSNEDNNESSIVLKISYKNIDFLYTGDAGFDQEAEMIATFNVGAEILKVGHHGSNTSTSQEFVNKVMPKVSILSYGADNSYGHPVSSVVNKLIDAGSKLFSTAELGDIVVTSNGSTYDVSVMPWMVGRDEQQPNLTSGSIHLLSVNLNTEVVTMKNSGSSDVSMTGWKLVSVVGNQTYDFPTGYVLKAGATVYINSGNNAVDHPPGHLKWTGSYIWNNSGDAAELYNAKGVKVDEIR